VHPETPQRRLLVLQTALKIVQLRWRELELRPLIRFQYLPSTVPVDNVFDVLNDRIRCLPRLPFLLLLGWREGRSVRESLRSRGSCSRRDVVIRRCIRRNVAHRLGVHRSILYDSCAFLYELFKQVRCWHVLENNARLRRLPTRCNFHATPVLQFPRAVPQDSRHLSPPIAQGLTDRIGRHDGHICCP
jgi:hypothetical protein